jgi:hypothetical protein
MLNIPRSTLPTMHQSLRSPRHRSIPEWETKLCAAIGDGLVAKGVFDWSSARRGNLILTSEFDLPGDIPVRFESSPSQQHFGAVDVSIVVYPRANLSLGERPGDIGPLLSSKGVRQGDATAMACIYDRECGPPGIALLYVSRWLQRKWQHVCDL